MHVAKATTRVCARWLSDGPVHSELLDRVVGGLGRALVEMCPVLPAAPPIHACVLFGDYLFFELILLMLLLPLDDERRRGLLGLTLVWDTGFKMRRRFMMRQTTCSFFWIFFEGSM